MTTGAASMTFFRPPGEHTHQADAHKKEAQGIYGHEHFLQSKEIADVGGIEKLPGGFAEAGQEDIDAACGKEGIGAFSHAAVEIAQQDYSGDAEEKDGDIIHQRHGDGEIIHEVYLSF